MAQHNDLGKWGEDEAARYLESKGYTILERDWKFGRRDLDIVALSEDGCLLAVVEVKTRSSEDLTEPEQAVDGAKKRSLAIAANAYVKAYHVSQEIRFDIVSIVGSRSEVKRIDHIVDSFNPMLIL